MKCIVCNKELTTADFESICNECKNKLSKSPIVNTFSNYGWECPKCGKVYAPFISECRFCNVEKSYISSTSTFYYGKYNNCTNTELTNYTNRDL